MTTIAKVAVLSAGILAALPAVPADMGIPARIRVLKGARQGPREMAAPLRDLEHQLSHTAYVRWEEAADLHVTMDAQKPFAVALPGGLKVLVTLVESRQDTATYEVSVPSMRTRSRLTIHRDKRIVHQVTPEANGEAYFITIRPWP